MPKKKRSHKKDKHHYLSEYLKMAVVPKNEGQGIMLDSIRKNIITFVKGSPGSGKTFLAVYTGLCQFLENKYANLLFSRPAVEAGGEKLGYLPGNIYEKIDPYMIPIIDALHQLLNPHTFSQLTNKTNYTTPLRILPLAYMRGITVRHSFCVIDEAQNMTPEQMRMLLTRIGEGSKMVICGDVRQSDVKSKNGLEHVFELLQGIDHIGFVTLNTNAIVRHPIIGEIEERYVHNKKHISPVIV
jgi:phosphate starvation-inducible protein PhoH and related proteins